MVAYKFGAGGFKLGERVEILSTGQRGVLVGETVHVSGCNTYQVLLPNVIKDGRMKITIRDYLMLRKLSDDESMLDASVKLTDDNSFSPKGIDVNAEWIRSAADDEKEHIPEIDDAVGLEDITILPGTEVWNKIYGKVMMVQYVSREIYSKEPEYVSSYMSGDSEQLVPSRAYALIPLEQKLDIYTEGKVGPVFEESRSNFEDFVNREHPLSALSY